MLPSISIIIPVLHEAHIINHLIGHLMRLPYDGNMEIIVVDGDPSGDSIQVIPGTLIKKILSRRGRGMQMNAGARSASGDILLFLHADTFLPSNGLILLAKAMQEPSVLGGAFDLSIDAAGRWFRWIEKAASLRSRITRIPYGDQAIFIRRNYFTACGGYAEIAIMEDVELMRRMNRSGHRITLLPFPVRTSPRRWKKTGILRNTLRNWMLLILFYLGVPAGRLKRFYR